MHAHGALGYAGSVRDATKVVNTGTATGFEPRLTSVQKWLSLASVAALASMACSAETTPTTPGQLTSNLNAGTVAPDTEAVFALQVAGADPRLCGAVLIAPKVLLTARHCLAVDAEVEVVCGESPLDRIVEPDAISLGNALAPLDTP